MELPDIDRRSVVKLATAVPVAGSVVALSACGSEESGPEAGSPVTVAAADVPVGSGLVEGDFVVTQPTDGEFHAFSAICPHQGCTVRTITETEIVCPCHSSKFSSTDGSLVSGPAETGLEPATLSEDGENLTVSAG